MAKFFIFLKGGQRDSFEADRYELRETDDKDYPNSYVFYISDSVIAHYDRDAVIGFRIKND